MRLHRRAFVGSIVATLFAGEPRSWAEGTTAPAEGADGFTLLEARPGAATLLPAPAAEQTKIWGFSGDVPGPLLRVKLGQEIKARLVEQA